VVYKCFPPENSPSISVILKYPLPNEGNFEIDTRVYSFSLEQKRGWFKNVSLARKNVARKFPARKFLAYFDHFCYFKIPIIQ